MIATKRRHWGPRNVNNQWETVARALHSYRGGVAIMRLVEEA